MCDSLEKNKFVSLGERVILINSVLVATPTFYMCYLRMPICVWKKIVSIQINFLWGGSRDRGKIAWVKLMDGCLSTKG
jgi:hypothetical protein